MKMTASDSTLALLASADGTANLAARLGVGALVALIEENTSVAFRHGDAVTLAGLLVNGGISKASSKRYADIAVMAVKAIAHQGALASAKAKPADKTSIRQASQMASLASLAGMSDMRKIREWSKDHGPKVATIEKAETAKKAETPAPTAETLFPPETPAQAEKAGQIREVRETLAMLNAGQLTQSEALETIASIVGSMIIKPVKPVVKQPVKPVKTGT